MRTSSKKKRLQYRLYRNPVVLVGLGALFMFLLSNRFPTRKVKRKERMSVLFTNLLILAMILAAARLIGLRTYLLIQLPVLCPCRGGGNLAVLRAASVPGRILGTKKRVGAIARRHGRQFVLQITCCAAVVFRQHWYTIMSIT